MANAPFPNEKAARKQATDYFYAGYNCAQSVLLSFAPSVGLSADVALRLAAPLGGGMGRLREVCGGMSGAFVAAGMIYGYTDPKDLSGKKACYQVVQQLAATFAAHNGSIICRELRGLPGFSGQKQQAQPDASNLPHTDRYLHPESPQADLRTPAYYASRPCAQLVGDAAAILAAYIADHLPESAEAGLDLTDASATQ